MTKKRYTMPIVNGPGCEELRGHQMSHRFRPKSATFHVELQPHSPRSDKFSGVYDVLVDTCEEAGRFLIEGFAPTFYGRCDCDIDYDATSRTGTMTIWV